MLQVTEDGIKLTLQSKPLASSMLTQIIAVSGVLAVLGVLDMLGVISKTMLVVLVLLTLVAMAGVKVFQSKQHTPLLTGGELQILNKGFIHRQLGQTTTYQLAVDDKLVATDTCLRIADRTGKILYQIEGFSEPRHLEVAQAVLQGKQIKTQAKAIKMQNSD